jgi:hypothetical protein
MNPHGPRTMQKRLLLSALALAGWMCVSGWSVARLLEPDFVLDILRLFTLC